MSSFSRPGLVKDLRGKLDAMTAPSLMNLRLNNQNVRKRLEVEGFEKTAAYKVPPLEKLRMEIRMGFQGRDWDFLETIQVVEFRDALEQKCGVPAGTFRNNTFLKLLSEEVQRHRVNLMRAAESEKNAQQAAAAAEAAEGKSPTAAAVAAAVAQVDDGETRTSSNSANEPRPGSGSGPPGKPKQKPEDCEALWASTFERLKVDGELHVEELARSLELIGIQAPEKEWIDEIITTLTRYSTLSLNEFTVFVKKYKDRQREYYKEVFNENDSDNSGAVDKTELRELLNNVGIVPLKHVLEQVMEEVDEDGSGTVGFDEFEKVMEILRVREGFTKSEVEEFEHAFKKFDRDGSGEIDTDELIGILGWLGYTQSDAVVKEVLQKVDFDGSGSVSKEEFLVCMRQFRQKEVDNVNALIAECDTDGSGTINSAELRGLLKTLGYKLSPDVLREIEKDAGCAEKAEMTFNDLWQMIRLFRMREGFLRAEVEELKEGFDKYDKRGHGEVDCIDLGHILRWLGYSPSLQEQQILVAEVDIDHSGLLDFSEFMKLMRKKREAFFTKTFQAFCKHEVECEAEAGTGQLKMETVLKALRLVGVFKVPFEIDKDQTIDFEVFVRMVKKSHDIARDSFRANAGFTDDEVRGYKDAFNMYDADRSGDISNRELQRLLVDLYPADAQSKESREKLAKVMEAADADGNGRLDFGDFLRMNRQYQTELENDRILKEHLVIEETGFDSSEVEGYRSLFKQESTRNAGGQLTFSDIRRMIHSIVPLGAKHLVDLKEIIGKSGLVEGSGNTVGFPEFLRVMKQVQDLNLANINEKSAEVAGQGQSQGQSQSAEDAGQSQTPKQASIAKSKTDSF